MGEQTKRSQTHPADDPGHFAGPRDQADAQHRLRSVSMKQIGHQPDPAIVRSADPPSVPRPKGTPPAAPRGK